MKKHTVISSKTAFKSKFFSVEQDKIDIEGKIVTKDIVFRDPIVLIIPFSDDKYIYLASQYRDALKKVSLELFAGHLEPGETPLNGAKRELQEESGLTAVYWKHLIDFNLSANMGAKVHVFVAEDIKEGQPNQDVDEDIEILKIPLEEALGKIQSGEIDASSHVAAILLFDKLRREGKF